MDRSNLPPNSIRLCIDAITEEGPVGSIFGMALPEPIPFNGLRAFIVEVDAAFDTIGRPQPNQLMRSFTDNAKTNTPYQAEPPRYHDIQTIRARQGSLKTYDLIMVTRHHAEWQGILKDPGGHVVAKFKSALECVREIMK